MSTEVNTLYLLSTKPIIQHCFLPGSKDNFHFRAFSNKTPPEYINGRILNYIQD